MKAQASIEFIVFVSLVLVVAIIVVVSWWPLRNAIYESRIETEAKNTLREVVFQINTAQKIGDGYVANFFLQPDLLGIDYDVNVESHFVVLNWTGRTIILPIIPESVSGNIQKGQNTIKNIDGEIYLN